MVSAVYIYQEMIFRPFKIFFLEEERGSSRRRLSPPLSDRQFVIRLTSRRKRDFSVSHLPFKCQRTGNLKEFVVTNIKE